MDKASHNAEKPLVTVLLPCYNGMPFLPEALRSIREQSYTNLEILCIDDGSTDETFAFLQEQTALDSRIVLVKNEQNIKLIATLNKGVRLAQGKYIARMDADDVALPNRFEESLKYLEADESIELVSPMSYIIDEAGKRIGKTTLRNSSRLGNLFASFIYTPIGHPEIMCRTELLKNNSYSNDNIALHTEDYEIWSRLLREGHNLINTPEYVQNFRVNSKSVSNSYTGIQNENFVRCAQDHFFKYFGKKLDSSLAPIFLNRMNSAPRFQQIMEGLSILKKFRKEFVDKEKISNSHILREIQCIYRTHRFDILVQSFKRSSFTIRIKLIPPLFSALISCFFEKTARHYILSKR